MFNSALLHLTIILSSSVVVVHCGQKYSKEEQLALQKFRPLVQEILTHDYQKIDSYLIKWLRARDLNLNEASEMLRRTIKWRRDNNIDSILKKRNILEEIGYAVSHDAVDKEGNPVLFLSFRDFKLRDLLLEGKKSQMHAGGIQLWEKFSIKTREASNRTGSDISQIIIIADIQGFSMTQHACLACIAFMKDFVGAMEDNYPGLRKTDITINVPRIYNIFLRNLTPILSKETKQIMHQFGPDRAEWSNFILKIIDANQLPYRYGGTKTN